MAVKNFQTRRRVAHGAKFPLTGGQSGAVTPAALCPAGPGLAAPNPARDAAAPSPPPPRDAGALAALEAEAVRRALNGVEVPVFHQGRECGVTVKHSDQLLMFLLKTLLPERYAGEAKSVRPTGPRRRPLLLDIDLSAAGDDDAPDSDPLGSDLDSDDGAYGDEDDGCPRY